MPARGTTAEIWVCVVLDGAQMLVFLNMPVTLRGISLNQARRPRLQTHRGDLRFLCDQSKATRATQFLLKCFGESFAFMMKKNFIRKSFLPFTFLPFWMQSYEEACSYRSHLERDFHLKW